MKSGTIWTVLGVIGAVVVAWLLINVLFSVIAFFAKLLIVAVVGVVVFFAIRAAFADRARG